MWPDRRLCELFSIAHPILQAPMAGANDWRLAAAAASGGALGAIPCGMLTPTACARRSRRSARPCARPFTSIFCHPGRRRIPRARTAWRAALAPYYAELGLDPHAPPAGPKRAPFDAAMAEAVEALAPEVVSFHFGLPAARTAPARARDRRGDPRVGDDGRRSALARGGQGRRDHRAGRRSRRPSRHVPQADESPRRSARWRWCRKSSTRCACR